MARKSTKTSKTTKKSVKSVDVVQNTLEQIVSDGSINTEQAVAMVSEAEQKQAEIDAAWAQHNPVKTSAVSDDGGTSFRQPVRLNADGQVVIFGSRREINLCFNRCMPEDKRLRLTEEGDEIYFADRKEINECWARIRNAQIAAEADRRGKQAVAKAVTTISDGSYHNLGDLQMLTMKKAA